MCVAVQKLEILRQLASPKWKKAAFNTELRKQGSHRTKRRGFKVWSKYLDFNDA